MRIQPTRGWAPLRLRELFEYRELVFFLVWRDVKVRYKQTVLGAAWAILQPLFTMLIFAIVFGRLAKMPSDGAPYALFAYTALVPWTFFATGLLMGSNSLVASSNLISKVYFPRLAIPLATNLAGVVDLVLTLPILFGLMWYYGVPPTRDIIWLVPLLVLALVTALGVGLWLSALNVEFRDVKYAVPFLTQLWMFATPIAYPSSLLPEQWRVWYGLNPMVGVVEGFRWSLLGTGTRPGRMIMVSALAAMAILVSGAFYFRRMERSFADRI